MIRLYIYIFSFADTSCSVPTTTTMSYSDAPTVYTNETYSFTGSLTGTGLLEFGFYSQTSSLFWHLDDVSIIDTNASNSEMLTNGGFEASTLNGWQVLCSSTNCKPPSGSILTNTSCYTGSYCYEGACEKNYDFLRQTFTVTLGHIYSLSFKLYTDSQPQQKAYVKIS
jgi:hypothetical protein